MQQGTIYRLNCHVWWKVALLQQPVMTSWVAGLRRSSKAFPKIKLAPKKSHGDCLVVCCPSDPLQLYEIQQKHYIWEMCSAYQWDAPKTTMPEASIGQQKEPDSSPQQFLTPRLTTNASKVEGIGLQSFTSSTISTWHLTKWPPLLQTSWQLYAGKMLPQPEGGRKCFPRIHWILKHRFLLYRNKWTFLIGKNVLIVMVPILIDKDVFEPN